MSLSSLPALFITTKSFLPSPLHEGTTILLNPSVIALGINIGKLMPSFPQTALLNSLTTKRIFFPFLGGGGNTDFHIPLWVPIISGYIITTFYLVSVSVLKSFNSNMQLSNEPSYITSVLYVFPNYFGLIDQKAKAFFYCYETNISYYCHHAQSVCWLACLLGRENFN